MIQENRQEVYIPIEIKPREFVSQLLLCGELAKKGKRVYLGSKTAIDTLINNKNNNAGVYLYKGGGSSINKFKNLSRRVESITVLDQEVTPALLDYEVSIKNRFTKGSLKYVSRLYYIGPQAKKAAINVLKEINPKLIKDTGWPRVDLWQPALHHIWDDEIKAIKSKFKKPFLLFTSNFGCNTQELVEQKTIRSEKRGKRKTKKDLEFLRNLFSNSYKTYKEFIEFLPTLNNDPEIPTIVIRPHPGEDHYQWKEVVKSLPNVYVEYDGDISPWLLASDGILHRGCTSAIEALISRKKFAFLSEFSIEGSVSLSTSISPNVSNIAELKEWIKNPSTLPIDDSHINYLLGSHIKFPKSSAACELAKDLSKLSNISVQASHIYKEPEISRFKIFFKKVLNKLFKRNDYLPKLPKKNKMQDGIRLDETEHFLSLMYPDLNFNLKEPKKELILIETAK